MATPTDNAATRIRLCGEFMVEIEGRRVEADIVGRQGRTLFAYLVLHRRRSVRREELIEALWPDDSPASSEAALSTVVSRLRKAVGHERLCGRSELRLDLPADASVDIESVFELIEQAEHALGRSAWEDASRSADAALSVAVRGFVSEVDAAWAEEERRRLDDVNLRSLECVATVGLALGGARLSATERAARRLIERAPFRETGYRYLMQALAGRGCVAEALRVFDDVRVLLHEDLAVAPSPELRALHSRLLIDSASATERPGGDALGVDATGRKAPVSAPVAQQRFPLPPALTGDDRRPVVGRDEELGRLWGLYDQVKGGTCRIAVVRGEPGIGKTRLAIELARRAHRDGAVALYGRCDEEPLVAHQPFVEALGHYVAVCPRAQLLEQLGPGGGELRRLVPGLAERVPDLGQPMRGDREGERYRLFASVGALLRRVGATTPVVLVLDDLHWADTSTVLLLRHVVRDSRATGLFVVGTSRDAEITRDHSLRDMLADLTRDPGCERLSLGALDRAAVEALIRSEAGDQAPELVRMLRTETEGNPFFICEMLRHLTESGRLSGDRNQQLIRGRLSDLGVPDAVKDVVARRFGKLGLRTQAVLATASVSGRAFEFTVLAHMSSRDQDELLEALEEAVRAKLIEEVPGTVGEYTFTHGLIRETVYGGLMRTRQALLHRRIATALETIHAQDLDAQSAELAHHFAHAGAAADIMKASGYAEHAGVVALAGLAYEQAAGHYRQAVRLLDRAELPPQPMRRCELLIGQGEAERQAGDGAYRQTLLEGARLAQDLGDADRLAQAALANNRGFFSAAAAVDPERVSVLAAALEAQGDRFTAVRARLLAQLAVELVPDPDWKRRAQLSDEALSMARRIGDPMTLACTLNHRYVALWGPRTLAERLANTQEASDLAERLGDPVLSFQSARFGSHAAMEAGDLALADMQLRRASELADQLGQPIIQWYYAVTQAKRESITGSPAVAEQLVRDAAGLGQRVGQPDAALWLSIGLFVTQLLQGTVTAAAPNPPDVAVGPHAQVGHSRSVALLTAALQAATASKADTADARARFDELMRDDLEDLPDGWTALAVPAIASVACTDLGDVARAQTLFSMLEQYAGQFVDAGPSWFGAVSHHLAGLAMTLGRLDEADAFYAEATRFYAALGATAWLIRVRLDWAGIRMTRHSAGDLEQTRAMLTDVLAMAQSIGLPEAQRTAASLLRTAG